MSLLRYFYLLLIVSIMQSAAVLGQNVAFSVKREPFSTSLNEEFSPVYYNSGLVYCSNALSNTSIKSENERLFNILYVQRRDSLNWKNPEIFSKQITTILNEGPATFSSDQKLMFYARNNSVEGKFKDINSPSNTYGIFSARKINDVWQEIAPFPFNSHEYSIGTPALSSDGNRVYFASDMPGGYGKTDLYYSDYVEGVWQEPVNMGERINTPETESYPFISEAGLLFFASDGLPGHGGKDIFYTAEYESVWQTPIHLDNDINSSSDDFGLITGSGFESGYFSSNRKNTLDIYSFVSEIPQFGYCDTIKYIEQCYEFYDERFTDTLHLTYSWDFGNGIKKDGYKVEHCFTKPGSYMVGLNIVHNLADSVFITTDIHEFKIEFKDDIDIQVPEFIIVGDTVELNMISDGTLASYNKELYWDIGEGYKTGTNSQKYVFNDVGEHYINLGYLGGLDKYGITEKKCVTKKVYVTSDYQAISNKIDDKVTKIWNTTMPQNRGNIKPNDCFYVDFTIASSIISTKILDSLKLYSNRMICFENGWVTDESERFIRKLGSFLSNLMPELKQVILAVHVTNKRNRKINFQTSEVIASKLDEIFIDLDYFSNELQCVGYGDGRPKSNKKTNQSLNQRIEFILITY